jgi:hypothetical protein
MKSNTTWEMAFPRKFKTRLELECSDVVLPNMVWVTYMVCGCVPKACGWEGWMLEAAIRKRGSKKQQLCMDSSQKCPVCARIMFRTAASLRFTVARNQRPDLRPGIDYEVVPMKWK